MGDERPGLAALDRERESLDMDSLRFVARRVFELECNWKVFVDNYLDGGYHVPHMHPDLARSLDLGEYRTRLGETWSVQSCPSSGDADRLGERAIYLWVHPNFMINRYGPWMDTNLVLPIDERRCRVVFDYYHAGEVDPEVLESALRESAQVQAEDTEVAGLVQEGLESGAYEGLYAPRFEAPMHQFHRMLFADFDD
jgi:choline monooxygenase